MRFIVLPRTEPKLFERHDGENRMVTIAALPDPIDGLICPVRLLLAHALRIGACSATCFADIPRLIRASRCNVLPWAHPDWPILVGFIVRFILLLVDHVVRLRILICLSLLVLFGFILRFILLAVDSVVLLRILICLLFLILFDLLRLWVLLVLFDAVVLLRFLLYVFFDCVRGSWHCWPRFGAMLVILLFLLCVFLSCARG